MWQPARRFRTAADASATQLMEEGVSLKVVAERLGDREDTVVKLYGHVTPRGPALGRPNTCRRWPTASGPLSVSPAQRESYIV